MKLNERVKTYKVEIFLGVIALVLIIIAVHPLSRPYIRSWFSSKDTVLLAKVTGDLTGQNVMNTVLKFQTPEGIKIEILNSDRLDEKLFEYTFSRSKDAYFELQSGASNLFLSDTTKDQVFDVVVPLSVGKSAPQLQVITYDKSIQSFKIVQSL